MSFRVLVIPEDPTYNGYILRPLAEKMLAEVGKPNARVTVLTNPRIEGYNQAVQAIRGPLAERYGHLALWLFFPDADKAANLSELESFAETKRVYLRCCAAEPEAEAWLLAGHRRRLKLSWPEVWAHTELKERIFAPFLAQHGDSPSPAGDERA